MLRALVLLVVLLPELVLAQGSATPCTNNAPCVLSRLSVKGQSTLQGTFVGGQLKFYGERSNTTAAQAIYVSDAPLGSSAGWIFVGDASGTVGNFAPKIEAGSWGAGETGLTFKSTLYNDGSTSQSAFEFDTGSTLTNSYLFRLKNNGSTKFLVDPGAAVISGAASGSVGFSVSQGAKICLASSSKCLSATGSIMQTDATLSVGGTSESGGNIFQCGSGSNALPCILRSQAGLSNTTAPLQLQYSAGTWASTTVPLYALVNNSSNVFTLDKDGNPTFTVQGAAAPTCDSTRRGMRHYTRSAAGVTDTEEVCMKSAADTYSWRTVITGG